MNLWDAPFRTPLKIVSVDGLNEEVKLVLVQLGIEPGEPIEKIQVAPLGDPLSLRIGEQLFTLRRELCRKIQVEAK